MELDRKSDQGKRIAYWTITGLLAFGMIAGARGSTRKRMPLDPDSPSTGPFSSFSLRSTPTDLFVWVTRCIR